jgi:outer membrane immunogenic protein
MARVFGVASFVLAVSASGGLAADIAARPAPVKAPVAVPYSWYGFYVGVQGGYGWGSHAIGWSDGNPPGLAPNFAAGAFPSSIAGDPRGFLGGIQYGTNWQFGRFVVGTESDFSYANIRHRETIVTTAPGFTTFVNTGEQRLKWFGTTRGRAGVLLQDNLLAYGTGGLANGRVEITTTILAPGAPGTIQPAGSRSKQLWGWAAGGGLEYGMGPWSAKVEYLHYDLGRLTHSVNDPTVNPTLVVNASTKFSGDLVRGALTYRFNWTPYDLIFGRR